MGRAPASQALNKGPGHLPRKPNRRPEGADFRLTKAIQGREIRALPARKRVTQSKTGAESTPMTGKLLLAKLLPKPWGKPNQARGERKRGAKPKTKRLQAASRQAGKQVGRQVVRQLGS